MASLVREMGELKMERLAAASTTTTDRMLGQTWSEQATHTSDILAGIQQLSTREYATAAQQAKAHLMEFQQQRPRKQSKKRSAEALKSDNSGSRLIDLIQGDEDGLQETKHMQPQLMELLRVYMLCSSDTRYTLKGSYTTASRPG